MTNLKTLLGVALIAMSMGTAKAADSPPKGWPAFCDRNPGDCYLFDKASVKLKADKAGLAFLNEVNDEVNNRVRSTPEAPGKDFWKVAINEGDCEDSALAKRRALLDRGIRSSAMSLMQVVPRNKTGPGKHIVLMVYTDKGGYILDNGFKFYNVQHIRKTYDEFFYVRIQDRHDHSVWHLISDGGPNAAY